MNGMRPVPGPHNAQFSDAEDRTAKRNEGGQGDWAPPTGPPDIYIAMGQTAENVAEYEGVSRAEMDEFAALSQNRAVAALENGFWEHEITPLPARRRGQRGSSPRTTASAAGTTVEKLAKLKPVFRPDGTVTAGNACPLNDGAAAVIVMSDTKASELGITPLARIVSSGVSALDPEIMGLGPIEACRQALERAGMTIDDIDLVEINEAFAAQVIPSARDLGIPWEKLNVNGGVDRARSPVRHDRRAHHDHADPRLAGRRQDVRPREHVRRRRPGHGHDRRAPCRRPTAASGRTAYASESADARRVP